MRNSGFSGGGTRWIGSAQWRILELAYERKNQWFTGISDAWAEKLVYVGLLHRVNRSYTITGLGEFYVKRHQANRANSDARKRG